MNTLKTPLLLAGLVIFLAGCAAPREGTPANTNLPPATQAPAFTSTESATATLTDTPMPLPTGTPTPTETPLPTGTPTQTPTPTSTPTPIPTYVVLRGQILPDQVVCHYGPGAPYLYKYGVLKGTNMEILRRIEGGNYIEVQGIGGNNPCWVRADYMKIKGEGDLSSVQPVQADEVWLPPSPYYGPATGVSARRDGNKVTVFWNPVHLKAGDGSEQTPYIVEAFVCQDGQFVFIPVGSWTTAAEVIDEPGCDQPSRGWMTAAEKHGYTQRVKIPWPAFTTPTP